MNSRKDGSITVFLSLILLLVLSILMTTIEVARVSLYQIHTDRALVAAMDSVLAQYYLPLYEDYHVFALEGSYGTGTMEKDKIGSLVTDYMEYTFVPDKNLKENLNELIEYTHLLDYFNLYGIETREVDVLDITTLLDFDGEYFRIQAIDYMKYATVSTGLDFVLGTLLPMEETNTVQTITKERQKVEESLTELEENIIELMSYIDGIQVGKKGVLVNRNGYLDVKNSFVKKICPYDITMSNTGINNEWVFASLKNEYMNPLISINNQMEWIANLKDTAMQKLEVVTEYRFCNLIDREAISDKEELKELEEKIKWLEEQIEAYAKEEEGYINLIRAESNKLKTLVSKTNKSIESALNVIDRVIDKQKIATKNIDDYEIYLNQKKTEISEELFDSLLEDFNELAMYKLSEDDINHNDKYDFNGMKDTLLSNKRLLDSISRIMDIGITSADASISEYKTMLLVTKEKFSQYSYKNLVIDYTSMQKPVESDSFFKRINDVFGIGVMGLVLSDTSKLSKKEVSSNLLPSAMLGTKDTSNPVDITNIIKESKVDKGQDIFNEVSWGFSTSISSDNFLNLTNDLSEALLYNAYLVEHFSNYDYESLESTSNALEYELEYILMGKKTDIDNLNGVIMKILLVRSMLNLGVILFHKETTGKASEIATLFLGFTGIPILVSILKVLLLVILSVVESLVDVSAMLKGKKLPLLKSGDQLQVSIEDLFMLSKTMILEKANKIENVSNTLSLGYKEYLYLFLTLEDNTSKSYRSMDLIQENMQLKYDEDFYIKNCIQSFAIDGTFEMDKKFVTLPYIHKILKDVNEKYEYKTLQGYSY